MTCYRIPPLFSYFLSLPSVYRSAATATVSMFAKASRPLLLLPLKTKLLRERISTLKLLPLAPWPQQKQKQTQESALLEFDAKVK